MKSTQSTEAPSAVNGSSPAGETFTGAIAGSSRLSNQPGDQEQWKKLVSILLSVLLLLVLFLISRHNYLLFHSLVELFSIAVAWGVFMLVWNARRVIQSDALVLLGTAYLFIGCIDLLHTLAYKGMGVFTGHLEVNLATQLWIAARYLEGFSLLGFSLAIGKRFRATPFLWGYGTLALALVVSIFFWPIFPDCYLSGIGLTPFKKVSEFAISLILTVALGMLIRKRDRTHPLVFRLMVGAILLTIASELAFTFYLHLHGFSNLIGHFAKIFSLFLVYLALIRSGLTHPYETLFTQWRESEELFAKAFYRNPVLMTLSRLEDGTYLDINHTFSRVTGYQAVDCIGKTSTEIGFIDSASRNRLKAEVAAKGRIDGMELALSKKDGTPMRLRYWGEPIRSGGQAQLLSIAIDITDEKRMRDLLEARLALSDYADSHSMEELLQRTMNEAERLTRSEIGFLHFFDEDQQALSPATYSKNTLNSNRLNQEAGHAYLLNQAGVLADCIRERRAIFHNDYTGRFPRKGLPTGLPPVIRELVVPVFHDNRIVSVLGVGNKPSEYSPEDSDLVSELANLAWDIVVRKKAQNDFVTSEKTLQNLIANLPGMVFRCRKDAQWTMGYASEGCLALTGHPPEDFIDNRHLSFNDIIHPQDRERVFAQIQSRSKQDDAYEIEYRILNRQGEERWVWERGRKAGMDINGIEVLEGFIADISDRKDYERQMQIQALVLDQIQDRVLITDLSGRITYGNNALLNAFGYTLDELVGRSTEIFEEQGTAGPSQKGILKRTLVDSTWHGEVENKTKDGRRRIMDLRTQIIEDTQCKPIALCGISTDITHRRRQEEEMRRLAMVIDQVGESVIITDPQGKIVFVNVFFEKITGYKKEDVVGRNPRILKSGHQQESFYTDLWETLSAGRVWKGRFVNRKKNGSLYSEKATISPVVDANGEITNFVAIKRDVSDEIRMEEMLSQAQKMEAIGTLAGGIAHDFNNILFPMVGFTEMIRDDLPDNSPIQDYVDEVLNASIRAKDLVGQILAFSRQTNSDRTAIRVQSIVKEVIKLVRAGLPSNIRIQMDIQADCPPILADATQIHQVIMNLITNAYHAMEAKGGYLTIDLKKVDIGSGHKASIDRALRAGPYLRLCISDTGHGIDKSVLHRIFEPYFTTKKDGKGTGLGLSVIHGIVTQCQGDIQVESSSEGTTFILYFPCLQVRSKSNAKEVKDSEIPVGDEHILLVDDEKSIVFMARRMLERLGYTVTSRTSSLEALELFESDPDRFDLVITDMTMPDLTGDRLTKKIKTVRPDIPLILCTGFSNIMDEERAAELGAQAFVLKPILKRDIAKAIRSALHGQ